MSIDVMIAPSHTQRDGRTKMSNKKDDGETIIAYKAFDANWQCRGFQYEVGKTYTHDGEAVLCESGFHACEAPLDVLNYYSITDSKFAQVELGGASAQKEDGDTKRAGKSIAIKLALSIADLISAQVEWTLKSADKKNVASGYSSAAASSGYSSTAASSGNSSAAASSGDSSKAASSGDSSAAASSGNSSTAASSGYSSKAASSGDYSKAASSGNSSKAASSGNSSTAASSGNSSKAASSGYSSKAASSGDYSTAACDTNGFACVAGVGGMVKGNAGSALSCGYKDAQGRLRIAVGYVGEGGINADTWYCVDGVTGLLVEVA